MGKYDFRRAEGEKKSHLLRKKNHLIWTNWMIPCKKEKKKGSVTEEVS